MIPREHLAIWLGVSAEGIRYITHRDRVQLPTTQGIWSTALCTDKQGRRRHVGHHTV